eukprot:4640214-Heterocapsa_arctica.AAC.1
MVEAEERGETPRVLPTAEGESEWRVAEPGSSMGPVGTVVRLPDMAWAGRLWGVALTNDGVEVPVQKVA